jgi:hypothetical protein
MKGQFQYITMVDVGNPGHKTKYFTVINKRYGSSLGDILWYGPWRQYIFEPKGSCVFSGGCLKDITSFLVELNKTVLKERRAAASH